MSYEKLGAIVESDGKTYRRKAREVNLPVDFMTDKEIEKLSSEVNTYFIEVKK